MPPSQDQFNAAIDRIERGLGTVVDADLIRRYVAKIEEVTDYYRDRLRETREMLQRERTSSDHFQRSLNEAFNTGSGTYIP
jgi:UDP:flavonoid glycosyltransferase YjiC (YdhE family)